MSERHDSAATTTDYGPSRERGAARFRWRLAHDAWLQSDRPVVMAVLNVTPDSFSDGGELADAHAAAERARRAAGEGADVLDLGGESTRPGASEVSEAEQIARVVPAIEAVRAAGIALPITVDTTRAAVARAALDAGADAVNDVSGGTDDDAMLPLIAERGCGAALMHRLTAPARDSYSTAYAREPAYEGGVVGAVRAALRERVARAEAAGVPREAVLVDPGLGFGKSVAQNASLLREAGSFNGLAAGTLVGASRKSFLAGPDEPAPADRDAESVAAAVIGLLSGARAFRVHAVGPHRRALDAADRMIETRETRETV